MFQVEKFEAENGKPGYKITGTFASSKNHNGAYFDPVEIFAVDNPPKDFNLAHKDYETDYKTGTETSTPIAQLDGKILKFNWKIKTTNENFVTLIDNDNFGGFSPELAPKNKPLKSEQGERFYRAGDLVWQNTAILEKGQKPGFVGADQATIEKFTAFEDVVILEKFEEEKTETQETPETKTDKTKETTEKFYFWGSVGSYVKYNSKIQKVIKSETVEGQKKPTFTLRDLAGVETQVQDSSDIEIETINASDVLDYILSKESKTESFEETPENKPEENPKEELQEEDQESEKFKELQEETEKFNQKLKAKGKFVKLELFSKGQETSSEAKPKADSYKNKSIINNIV